MNRLRNNLFSILLAVIPVMGFSFSVIAKENELYSVTVTNATRGQTYAAYKIFDVDTADEDPDSAAWQREYTISDKNAWYDMVSAAQDIFSLTSVGDGGMMAVTLKEGATAREAAMLFIKEGIPEGAIAESFADIPLNEYDDPCDTGSARIEVAEKGVYYINTQSGTLILINGAYNDISIREKKMPPSEDITYGFSIRKTGNALLLNGAIFRLYRNPEDAKADKNAMYFTVDETESQYTVCETLPNSAQGEAACDIHAGWTHINLLTPGSYYLSEISAPGGYQKNPSVLQIVIEDDGTVLWREDISGEELEEATDGIVMIENKAVQWMPGTGGTGRWPFYVSGIAFICLALAVLLKKGSDLP